MTRSKDRKDTIPPIQIPPVKQNFKPKMDTQNKRKNKTRDPLITPAKPKSTGVMGYIKSLFTSCNKSSNQPKPVQSPPARKAKIPLALKQTVWVNQFGEVYKRKCPVRWCHRVITVFDFEVGHNIPESRGGTTTPDNLRPICRQCNIGMGNRYTIDDWSQQYDKK